MSTDNRFDETAECRRCHDQRIIMRRGLCSDCIIEEVEAGTLDKNYPQGSEREDQPGEKEEPMSEAKECAKCGEEKKIIGRGLCSKCYFRARKAEKEKESGGAPKVSAGPKVRVKAARAKAQKRIVITGDFHTAEGISAAKAAKAQREDTPGTVVTWQGLFYSALDGLGEAAESLDAAGLGKVAQMIYATIGRLTREARKANVL